MKSLVFMMALLAQSTEASSICHYGEFYCPKYQQCISESNRPSCKPDGSEFIVKGEMQFDPWSTPDYCEDAKEIANINASAFCRPISAGRTSEYVERFVATTCVVEARYICK